MVKNNITFNDLDFSLHLKRGNRVAFKILFEQLYPKLYNYIFKMSNNHQISEDVVQNAFIKLWERKDIINTEFSIENYLITICRNEFLILLRKEKKEISLLDELKYNIMYEVIKEGEYDIKIEQLKEVIKELPQKTREAFVLSRYQNLKYKEIAIEMGISIKTVEKHISKALKIIKIKLH